jgi:di- and tripeptidase
VRILTFFPFAIKVRHADQLINPTPPRAGSIDDKVRPVDEEETQLFRLLEAVTQLPAASLKSRWREPSLTIHSVRGSGPHNPTVIPASVAAQVSLRIVPDQVLDDVCVELVQHLRASFDALNSTNTIKVCI